MSTRSTGGVVGACPSIEEPFEAADGRLVRLRVPGGVLLARQVSVVAEAARLGNGVIEITSRANLQLRGFSTRALAVVAPMLAESFPARVDVMTSPTAGVDPGELVDTRPLVAALTGMLARLGPLSPKLGVLVDGAGRVHGRGRACDVALGALLLGDGTLAFELRIGEALPAVVAAGDELVVIAPDDAEKAVAAVARRCGPSVRARDLVADVGRAAVLAELAADVAWTPRPAGSVQRPSGPSWPAIGLLDQTDDASISIGLAPLLGRIDPDRLLELAGLASRDARGGSRLTPERGVVLPSVRRSAAPSVLAALEQAGMVCSPGDPALSVIACAGRTGCAAGLADTQADGLAVIAHLRTAPESGRPAAAAVHLSGCPKRCAGRGPDELVLMAGPDPETYLAQRGTGEPVTSTPAGAVASLAAAGASR